MPMTAATHEKISRDKSETLVSITAATNETYEKMSTDKLESLVPMTAATNEMNEKTSRDKFITCVFLAEGVDTKKYGELETKLNCRPNRIEWSG